MSYARDDMARLLTYARMATDSTLAKLDEGAREAAIERGAILEENDPLHDRNTLALLLTGLMDRAQLRGVPWADIQADAEEIMRELAELRLTLQVQ